MFSCFASKSQKASLALQLTVMNTRRLTNKGAAKIEQIGQPTNLLQSLGPYITGDQPPSSPHALC